MAQARTSRSTSRNATAASIGRGTKIRGRVSGDGDLTVEGQVEGDVRVRGDVTVAEGAAILGDVLEGHTVRLDGHVEATVIASGPVHLGASCKVRGDLKATGIAIDDGADFAGRIDCDFELPAELGGSSKRGR